MIERRQAIRILGGTAFTVLMLGAPEISAKSSGKALDALRFPESEFRRRIAAIESGNGGRLGVAMLDTATGARFAHRGDERFPMCSTFKFLLAGAMLARVDAGRERLDRRVAYGASDLVPYSPITKEHADGAGLTIAELCEATMTLSDNTAANLLIAALGGTTAFNAFVRGLGDRRTRLDRLEPALNEAAPGDPRDTTTPLAMLGDLQRLLIGKTLSAPSRTLLLGWLAANKTGGKRLRAGLPAGWRAGDKTGTGERGTANDIGILWGEHRPPILVASYLTASPATDDANHAVHAAVARTIVEAVG